MANVSMVRMSYNQTGCSCDFNNFVRCDVTYGVEVHCLVLNFV
jgi:hypothetical protein